MSENAFYIGETIDEVVAKSVGRFLLQIAILKKGNARKHYS